MKIFAAIFICLLSFQNLFAQSGDQNFITTDIDNFWNAYDKITATKDRGEQLNYINTLFIEPGSPGLKGMMQARSYTAESYIDAINKYPLFWNSTRPHTLKAKGFAKEIETEVLKIKELYPPLKPSKIYFTIGALRSGGTTLDGMVLIGSELALGDRSVVTSEFGQDFSNLKPFFDTDPITNLVHTNVHEYIHTQQKMTIGNNLLAQSVLEGVAEFVTNTATGMQSWAEAFSYGRKNDARIKQKFAGHMFNSYNGFWLYSNVESEFNVRDLGYYTGYAICEKYYEKAANKKLAIKEMIELDYNNEKALAAFVQRSGYFDKSVKQLKADYEKTRPRIVNIKQLKVGDKSVDPKLTRITVEFSRKMDTRYRNFELGPLGEANLLRVKNFIGFAEDKMSAAFEVELTPGKQYQIILGDRFRSDDMISLKPFLINFKTAER